MLRFSRLTDYAVVLMTQVARDGAGSSWTAREWADRSGLPLPTVSKLLKTLAGAGLLESQRGAGGGYRLARPSEQISVKDVIEAVEGPVALTNCCAHAPSACELASGCTIRGNWQKINRVVRQALGHITLKEMTEPLGHSLERLRAPGRGDQIIQIALESML